MAGQYAKDLSQYMFRVHFGYLITVCDRAEQRCLIFPGMGVRLHWCLKIRPARPARTKNNWRSSAGCVIRSRAA
jgi:hypothetical protein